MPRIPQLTRLKGLSNLPTSISHSPIIPFAGERCTSCQTITISSRRSIPTRFRSSAFIRLYSSEKQSTSLSRGNEDIEVSEDDLPQQWQTSAMPPPRSYAERPDEVLDTAYVPALTSEGLESVGGVENWWEKEAHWPKSADFVGFKSPNKVTDPAVIETSIRQAVVEAFTLSQAGRIADLTRAWPTTEQEYLRRLLEVDIRLTENGGVSLGSNSHVVLEYFDSQNKPSESSNSTTEEPVSEGLQNEPVLSAEEAQVFRGVWGDNWKSIPLSDRQIKFAVTKRVFQLTGQLIHDYQSSDITDVQTLIHVIQKPPKPKTLTQEIQERQQDLIQLPNVSVATKRVTRGDKATAFGRFKLVEEELKKRDLPLKGHGFVRKNKEMTWLNGGA